MTSVLTLMLESERVRLAALLARLNADRTADCLHAYLASLAARPRVGEGETASPTFTPPSPSGGGAVSTPSPTKPLVRSVAARDILQDRDSSWTLIPDRRGKRAVI